MADTQTVRGNSRIIFSTADGHQLDESDIHGPVRCQCGNSFHILSIHLHAGDAVDLHPKLLLQRRIDCAEHTVHTCCTICSVTACNAAKMFRIQRVQADVHCRKSRFAVHLCLRCEQRPIGSHGDLPDSAQPVDLLHQPWQIFPYHGFPTGQTHFSDSQLFHDPHQPEDFFQRQYLLMG